MLRRRILLFPIMVILVATVGGGVVAAQSWIGGGNAHNRVLDRASDILGLGPDELNDAIAQARTELSAEDVAELLDDLVSAEKITQDDADAIAAWLDDRPDAIDPVGPALLRQLVDRDALVFSQRSVIKGAAPFFGGALDFGRMHGKLTDDDVDAIQAWLDEFPSELSEFGINDLLAYVGAIADRLADDGEPLEHGIEGLVSSGVLTQEQADTLEAWLDSKPDAVTKLLPGMILPGGGDFELRFDSERLPRIPGDLHGFRGLDDLLKGFCRGPSAPEAFDFDSFRNFGLRPFGMGEGFGFRFDENGNPPSYDELREQLEEQFRNGGFDGGHFRFRFGDPDGEGFEFEFGDDPDEEDDSDSESTSL
jgi:hypothetical protein